MSSFYMDIKQFLNDHPRLINRAIIALVVIAFTIYCYGCEPTTPSLIDSNRRVNRMELQLEFDQITATAEFRMLDLDKQDELRAIVLQNALILVRGEPMNPFGIITAIAAIYGIKQGGCNISKTVKNVYNKRKENNA